MGMLRQMNKLEVWVQNQKLSIVLTAGRRPGVVKRPINLLIIDLAKISTIHFSLNIHIFTLKYGYSKRAARTRAWQLNLSWRRNVRSFHYHGVSGFGLDPVLWLPGLFHEYGLWLSGSGLLSL